jgi:hypothetical protein
VKKKKYKDRQIDTQTYSQSPFRKPLISTLYEFSTSSPYHFPVEHGRKIKITKGLVRNVDRDLIYFCQERKRRIDKCCCKMFISSSFLKVVKDLLFHMFTVITSFISSQRFINVIHCLFHHFCSKFTVSNKFENPTFLGFLLQQHPSLHNTRNFSVTFGEFSFSYKRTKFSP